MDTPDTRERYVGYILETLRRRSRHTPEPRAHKLLLLELLLLLLLLAPLILLLLLHHLLLLLLSSTLPWDIFQAMLKPLLDPCTRLNKCKLVDMPMILEEVMFLIRACWANSRYLLLLLLLLPQPLLPTLLTHQYL